jgi:hypothetical protein
MELVSGIPLVDVVIGEKTYKFMFDTGAFSIIPKSIMERLSLEPLKEDIKIVDASGVGDTLKLYTLPLLEIGGMQFCDFRVGVADFAQQFPVSCLGFDGIFGYNFLENLVVKLEYDKRKITLSDKKLQHKDYQTLTMKHIPYYPPMIHFDFGFTDLWIGIDTGKNDGILIGDTQIQKRFKEHGLLSKKTFGFFSSSFSGINHHRQRESFLAKDFSLDKKIEIQQYPIDFDDSAQYLIGNQFLKNFNVVIDFKRSKVHLKKLFNGVLCQGFEDDFGFSFFYNESQALFISAIEENSPAAKVGLKLDDKVLEINGVDTLHFSAEDFCKLIVEKQYKNVSSLELVLHRDHHKILKKTVVRSLHSC